MRRVDPDDKCLRCICEASSGCNTNVGCSRPYYGDYSCGPFGISWRYWADAGSPKQGRDLEHQNSESDFENCVEDPFCAIRTVENYIKKFKEGDGRDCNRDGTVNCYDYIQMHILGGYNCNQSSIVTDSRYEKFQKCYNMTWHDIVDSH
ncbi:lysozyme-like isoform X2 [Macrobrachium nipponense]